MLEKSNFSLHRAAGRARVYRRPPRICTEWTDDGRTAWSTRNKEVHYRDWWANMWPFTMHIFP